MRVMAGGLEQERKFHIVLEVHEGHNTTRDAKQATTLFKQQTFSHLLFSLFRCPSGVAVPDTAS